MKGFVFVLLCALVAVEPRYTDVSDSNVLQAAAPGECPWFIHLRVAIGTSGLLRTGAASLINERWALTSAHSIVDTRFIWLRYGALDVIAPKLVTESSTIRIHSQYNAASGENNVGLVSINRNIETSDKISVVKLSNVPDLPPAGIFCAFGANDDNSPGERLLCAVFENIDDVSATEFDSGAPLVNDGNQVAILTGAEGGKASFTPVADYISWIESQTGLVLRSNEEPTQVRFVD